MEEGKKLISIAGITVAVYWMIKYLLPYVIPFFISYLLVHVLNPVTEIIRKKIPWKKSVIAGILLILILLGCTLGFYYLYCLLMEQIRNIAVNFEDYYRGFCEIIDDCCFLAERKFGIQVDEVKKFVYTGLDDATQQIRVYIIPGVVNYSVKYLKKLVRFGIFILMIFIAVLLLMKDYDEMKIKFEQYRLYQRMNHITSRMWHQGGMYLKAQITIIGIISFLCTIGLWILGNPYFFLLGIIAGITDAFPFIGTGIILIPIAVSWIFRKNAKMALGYAGLFLLTYIVREILEPRLIGRKLGIYPFVLVITVYAGIYLYGIAGVILGPVTLLTVKEIWNEVSNPDYE